MSKSFTVKKLAFAAVALALAYVLSWIKLINMPMGGTVTLLSMFFISIIGYWYGPVVGIIAGLAYGALQMTQDLYVLTIVQVICDYFLAFGALGFSGFLWKMKAKIKIGPVVIDNLIFGYLLAVIGRYFFSFISGWVFFGEYASYYGFSSGVIYSLAYNGAYIGLEAAITIVILLIPPVRKGISRITAMAKE